MIDEQGTKKRQKIQLHDVWSLSIGEKVMLPFDPFRCPTTDASAIFAQFLGDCAKDTTAFPINFDDWRKIPKEWKNNYFENTILPKFHFENVDFERARDYTKKVVGKKRHDCKLELWKTVYDPLLTRDEMCNKEICRKNKVNRRKLRILHTGGSKSLSRKRNKMEIERGELIDRGELYIETHKKKSGSFVNKEARVISILRKEHSRRVRSMGLGPTPSSFFGMPTRGYGNASSSSYGASSINSELVDQIRTLKSELESERGKRNALENVKHLHSKRCLRWSLKTLLIFFQILKRHKLREVETKFLFQGILLLCKVIQLFPVTDFI